MPGEDEIDVPDAWRHAVHPRRHPMAVLGPALSNPGDGRGAADKLAAERGLAGAVAEFARTCGAGSWEDSTSIPSLMRPTAIQEDSYGDSRVRGFLGAAARHLRWLLAVAPQDVNDGAVAALTALRGGTPGQRIVTSYLAPDLGLDGDPVRYRGVSYTADLGAGARSCCETRPGRSSPRCRRRPPTTSGR